MQLLVLDRCVMRVGRLFVLDPNNTCVNGAVRLTGGSSASRGRLELCYDDHWGTVCDDEHDGSNAGVVCRQLGYPAEGNFTLAVCIKLCRLS